QCQANCSFVSGEASASFWLVAFAFVVPRRWRAGTAIGTLAFALAISINRMAFGGHFLSDVVLAWGLTLVAILATYAVVFADRVKAARAAVPAPAAPAA